jgi:glycosyltransferase involved in cell wall biosynthesis
MSVKLLNTVSLEDAAADGQILEASGLFDLNTYRAAARIGVHEDAIKHYLCEGWSACLEPNTEFEGRWLYPFFQSVGLNDPPALTYLTLRAANWPVFENRAAAERVAAVVAASSLFDAKYYARHVRNIGGLDPVLHYIIVGEQMGFAPSAGFDPTYYMERNPDIGQNPICRLYHYIVDGRREGRRPISVAAELKFGFTPLYPRRETVLLVTHQTSRTGAPILAYNIAKRLAQKYNVVTLVLQPGELMPDFEAHSVAVVGPDSPWLLWVSSDGLNPVEAKYIVKRLLATYSISFAIANSIDTRTMLPPLHTSFVPIVTLVHEFASDLKRYDRPGGEMGRALEWTTQIVFSSKFAAESARSDYPHLDERPVHILPQGPSELPPRGNSTTRQLQDDSLRRAMRPSGTERHIVVLGCGTVFARKGVDLFFECAKRVAAIKTKQRVRFVWIGQRLPVSLDGNYFAKLTTQIRNARITDRAIILDEVTDLEPAYASADILFLSSRLDPLPNVAIDSALRGLPIVCFEDTGGIPELLKTGNATALGVVPHLDVNAAAAVIVKLADDDALRQRLGSATQQLGRRTFDMDRYVECIDNLGHEAAQIMRQRIEDFETIRADSLFDMFHFLDYESPISSRDDAIRLFLARASALSTSKQPTTNFYFRRPCPGFHPQIYVCENANRYDANVVNPLAHYIRAGKPDGPWRHDVITPQPPEPSSHVSHFRTAVHGHFFYPELYANFLSKISVNENHCDLLLSTCSDANVRLLRRATANYNRGEVIIKVVPNRGRDIGAMLTAFPNEIRSYDVVGHFHSKRSFHLPDPTIGERWREFLWQNLLGGYYPMMDTILNRFAKDESIGLIFADDPHLSDWDFNRQISEDLARTMGIEMPLPLYLDFPIGTMFWARSRALEPLFNLELNWDDYPVEPAPSDGTILHAIERLLPLVASHAGYRYATTHLTGTTW